LEIYADDVKLRTAPRVGQVSEEVLFYLAHAAWMNLPRANLLLLAFANECLDRMHPVSAGTY